MVCPSTNSFGTSTCDVEEFRIMNPLLLRHIAIQQFPCRRSGFSLMELLVLITIVTILMNALVK